MTDSIRPLVTLVEAITRNSKISNANGSDQGVTSAQPTADPAKSGSPPLSVKPFASLLKARLAGIERSDKKQLRKAFVEVSLVSEFGEELIVDPEFSTLVEQVSEIIFSDQTATLRLDQTLENYLP